MTVVIPSSAASDVAPGRWDGVREELESLRADCARDHAESVAGSVDDATDSVALARRSGLAATLAEIDAALLRLADGTYGACTRCGAAIPAERLEFRPYAAQCVICAGRS